MYLPRSLIGHTLDASRCKISISRDDLTLKEVIQCYH